MNKNIFFLFFLAFAATACKPVSENNSEPVIVITNSTGTGNAIDVALTQGLEYNHPLLAIWVETAEGRYVQTLYVSQSIAKGFFARGDSTGGKWSPGARRRPAALPYWGHKRNVKEADGFFAPTPETPMPDAYTGATPLQSFVLKSRGDSVFKQPFRVLLEINQCFDWNRYWTTTRFPGDYQYSTSGQPSLIYSTGDIDPNNLSSGYSLKPIGHGHFAGSNGQLFPDVSGHTSALEIVKDAKVTVR